MNQTPSLLRILFASVVAMAVACGDLARSEVALHFPTDDSRAQTQQMLVVIREPAPSGAPCAALWSSATGLREGAWLIDYPNPIDISVARLETGPYTVFAYALSARLDLLCRDDSTCSASSVGPKCNNVVGGQRACQPADQSAKTIVAGCSPMTIVDGELGRIDITLAAKP